MIGLPATVDSPTLSTGHPKGVLGPVVSIILRIPPCCGATLGTAFAPTFCSAAGVDLGTGFSAALTKPVVNMDTQIKRTINTQYKLFFIVTLLFSSQASFPDTYIPYRAFI